MTLLNSRSALTRLGVGLTVALVSLYSAHQANAEPIYAITVSNQLIAFDSATPSTVTSIGTVTGIGAGEQILGIDFRPATGQLYGLGSLSNLYTLSLTTATATQVGSSGAFTLIGSSFGFDFNPTVDRIRVTSDADQNIRLNPDNGTIAGVDSALNYAAGDVNAGLNPTITGSAYTNNVAGAATTTLYDIDANLNILATQIPPNSGTLNTVGAVTGDPNDLLGFDISGRTGIAYLAYGGTGLGSQLYTINLATGGTSLVGTIGGSAPVRDISAAPVSVPEPGTLLLFGMGTLLLLRRRSSVQGCERLRRRRER